MSYQWNDGILYAKSTTRAEVKNIQEASLGKLSASACNMWINWARKSGMRHLDVTTMDEKDMLDFLMHPL